MKRNRISALALSLVFCMTFAFSAFSAFSAGAIAAEKPVRVVATIFPVYDGVREVAGGDGNTEITMLLDSGVDLHSYQPTAADILKIATCDVFIYVGGESDDWVEDALKEAVNPDLTVINLLDALGEDVKMEELVEGMQRDHEHDDDKRPDTGDHDGDADHDDRDDEDRDTGDLDRNADHDDHDDADHDPEGDDDRDDRDDADHDPEEEADEHIWLSLRNAQKLTAVVARALGAADPARAEFYQTNAAAYAEKLADLDARYAAMAESAAYKTVLFGDRFPFRYLVDDYGLGYYAAFSGCSAETEASFQTIVFLAQKVNELNLPAVLTIEGTNHKIAETIIQTTNAKNQKLLTVNSMQGVIAADVQAGASYLGYMENNLDVFTAALN